MSYRILLAALAGVLLSQLLTPPVAARSTGAKRSKVTQVIVHATGGPSCSRRKVVFSEPGTLTTMKRFFDRSGSVSIHYIVGRDGKVAKGIPEDRVAIHTRSYNENSIGIEMINRGDGSEPFSETQFIAMVELVRGIRRRHKIKMDNIQRHSDVDRSTFRCNGRTVRRKQDPGPAFDWNRFRIELLLDGAPKLVRRGRVAVAR